MSAHLSLSTAVAEIQALDPIALPLLDSLGCVLAQHVIAPTDVPSFPTAEVAGFAIRHADHAPGVVFRVIDEVPAGFRATEPLIPGTCIAVTRGAPVPDEADTIVALSNTRVVEGGVLLDPTTVGSSITGVGELIGAGAVLAREGDLLDSSAFGLLARAGIRSVDVHPRPRVLVVSVGTEYVEPGVPTPVGLVSDHLSLLAAALVTESGGMAFRIPPVIDETADVVQVVEDNAHRSDLIVLCGIQCEENPEFLSALDLQWVQGPDAWSVLFGRCEGAIVLGLPDDPEQLRLAAGESLPVVIGRLMGRHPV